MSSSSCPASSQCRWQEEGEEAGEEEEGINLVGWSYQANEKSSGLTFHMNPTVSARIKEETRQELHFVATISDNEASALVFANSSTLWE